MHMPSPAAALLLALVACSLFHQLQNTYLYQLLFDTSTNTNTTLMCGIDTYVKLLLFNLFKGYVSGEIASCNWHIFTAQLTVANGHFICIHHLDRIELLLSCDLFVIR